MAKRFAFVSVSDPRQFKDTERQKLVQQHVGRLHRNRSAPLQRLQQGREQQRSKQQANGGRVLVPNPPGTGPASISIELIPNAPASPAEDRGTTIASSDQPSCSGISSRWSEEGSGATQPDLLWPQERLLALLPGSNKVEDEVNGDKDFNNAWTRGVDLYLDQSRADPFATYPVDGSDRQISLLVDHAIQHFWSCLSPDTKHGVGNPANNVYLMHMRSSALAYFTYSISISTNFDYMMDQNPLQKNYQSLRARHIHAATQLVRKTIQEMPENPTAAYVSEELIGAVITLAANHRINVINRKDWPAPRFRSPMATFQCLDMWGALPFIRPHRLAIVQLVNMRGGMERIGLTMAGVVQLNDLIDCSRNCIPPMVPWRGGVVPLPPLRWPYRSTDNCDPDDNLTTAFSALGRSMLLRRNLGLAISAIAHTTTLLDEYHLQGHPDMFVVHLVESRNRAHHLTLSLLSDSLPSHKGGSHIGENADRKPVSSLPSNSQLFKIITLSLLIYNNTVIFPLPPSSGLHGRLARDLKHLFCSTHIFDTPPQSRYIDLFLWSLILGGISDHDDTDRAWYKHRFKELLDLRPDLQKWHRLERTLTSFLWSDFVLNEEAVKFWSELFDDGKIDTGHGREETDPACATPYYLGRQVRWFDSCSDDTLA